MTGTELPITVAGTSDLSDFASHVVRHLAESGTSGSPHFSPVWEVDRADVMRETERRWLTPPHHVGWGRTWLVWTHRWMSPAEPRPRVIGHLELRGGLVASALHRVELSLGIEAEFRGRGAGRSLIEAALAWSRANEALAYVDLRVFAENTRARALYEKLGFREIATIRDAFRMRDGTRVDDILMLLELRETAR
ncbi:MAG: GNAT family N-acetyltransferase [Myxococcales bacterium]|nr:GNAT family N-acetyltransferase [Myxococcales bacterium]